MSDGRRWKGVSHHLASKAGFTDGVWFGSGGDLEASDQVIFDHLPEDRVTWVTEVTMPEFQVHWKSGGGREVG